MFSLWQKKKGGPVTQQFIKWLYGNIKPVFSLTYVPSQMLPSLLVNKSYGFNLFFFEKPLNRLFKYLSEFIVDKKINLQNFHLLSQIM